MAKKPLVFDFQGREIPFSMSKVDRAKLYGYKELEVVDDSGRKCELATLAGDGHTVVGRGGTGMGYVSQDGLWRDRDELTPIDLEGNEVKPVPSSFSSPVPLGEKATIDEYLSHNVRSVYLMNAEEQAADQLIEELKSGTIFRFPYSFRSGLQPDAGFLLMGDDGNMYFAVGNPTDIEFVGLQQMAAVVEEEGFEEEEEEEDVMDFGMI